MTKTKKEKRISKLEDRFVKHFYIIQRVSKSSNIDKLIKRQKYVAYKIRIKKYHTVGIIPKSNIFKITERDKINTPNIQLHDFPLS